jgi:hypothetical protein
VKLGRRTVVIPAEQLNEWADDLNGEIAALDKQILSLQEKRAGLQAKKTALDYLTGSALDGHRNKLDASHFQNAGTRRGEARRGSVSLDEHAPQAAYRALILETLLEIGGKGYVPEILQKVKLKAEQRGLLLQRDYGDVPSGGEEYWRNLARWERKVMKDRGLLRPDSPRGIWEITDQGRKWLERQKSGGNNNGENRSLR